MAWPDHWHERHFARLNGKDLGNRGQADFGLEGNFRARDTGIAFRLDVFGH